MSSHQRPLYWQRPKAENEQLLFSTVSDGIFPHSSQTLLFSNCRGCWLLEIFWCSKYVDIICKWLREWLLTIGEVVVGGGGGDGGEGCDFLGAHLGRAKIL